MGFSCNRYLTRACLSLLSATLVLPAWSEPVEPSPATETLSGIAPGAPERFGRYEDSFMVWNRMQNNAWAGKDERALRARYSFKYTFCGPQVGREGTHVKTRRTKDPSTWSICPEGDLLGKLEFFAAYTGEFDFYLGTRDSGPVINRLSMPGFYLRAPLKLINRNWSRDIDSIEFGWQHRSNGQVADAVTGRGPEVAQAQYLAGQRAYFDTVSRGANFFSVALDRAALLGLESLSARAKLRLYHDRKRDEDQVTWGPLAGTGRRFADYDLLDLRLTYQAASALRFDVEWKLGFKGLATDSWTVGVQYALGEIPLYLRYHRGPMNTLSNYTQRQDSLGLGLLLARF